MRFKDLWHPYLTAWPQGLIHPLSGLSLYTRPLLVLLQMKLPLWSVPLKTLIIKTSIISAPLTSASRDKRLLKCYQGHSLCFSVVLEVLWFTNLCYFPPLGFCDIRIPNNNCKLQLAPCSFLPVLELLHKPLLTFHLSSILIHDSNYTVQNSMDYCHPSYYQRWGLCWHLNNKESYFRIPSLINYTW